MESDIYERRGGGEGGAVEGGDGGGEKLALRGGKGGGVVDGVEGHADVRRREQISSFLRAAWASAGEALRVCRVILSVGEVFGSRSPSGAVYVLLAFLGGLDYRIYCFQVVAWNIPRYRFYLWISSEDSIREIRHLLVDCLYI